MFGLELGAALTAAKALPWKWIGVGLAALAIALTAGGIYLHIESLQNKLTKTASQLAEQRVLTEAEKARATAIEAQHDVQIERINTLEGQRSAISTEVLALRQQIQDLDIEQDIAGDDEDKAKAAIGRLNSRSADLNRLLERASGAGEVRTGPGPGSKARKTGAAEAVRRALEAVR